LVATLTVLVAEAGLRVLRPTVRRQVFRVELLHGYRVADGVPVWTPNLRNPAVISRRNLDCLRDNRRRIVAVGSSITYGMWVEPEQTAHHLVERHLRAQSPDDWPCMVNLGSPGTPPAAHLATARDAAEAYKPELLLVEYPGGGHRTHTLVGDAIYDFDGACPDETGLPNPLRIPGSLNARLLTGSRLYEYALLALSPDDPTCATPRSDFGELLDQYGELGMEVLVVIYPFMESEPLSDQDDRFAHIAAAAEARGMGHIDMWRALQQHPVETIRATSVHLNPEGHRLLSELLVERIEPQIDPR